MDSKLRVGFLLDSYLLPAWAFAAVEQIVRSNHVEMTLVVLNRSQHKEQAYGTGFWQNYRHWHYQIFNSIDERLFLHGSIASAQIDAAAVFSNVSVFEVSPMEVGGEQHFSASDVERIKSYQLDILIKMGFSNLRGDISLAARYGIWGNRWGDRCKIKDGLAGFWEVVWRWSETGAALQQFGVNSAHDRTLSESWFFTYPYSPARNRNYILWAASSFLPRQIECLYHLGNERFLQKLQKANLDEVPTSLKPNDIPSNLMVVWIMLKLAVRNLMEICRRNFYREQWNLLFKLGRDAENNITAFRKISSPKDRFWADPHVIYKEPNYYIFVEEYLYQTRRGHISVIEMDPQGIYKPAIPVLQQDCHLSFPFVFSWMDRYYMIPESSGRRTIDLYECVEFPDQWQFKITLMKDVRAVDTTLLQAHGKWWLFTAISEQEAAAPQVELFLFSSDELFTNQWHAHPMNPIVSDVKRARAAGSIFVKGGKLFRPSQDCSKAYGYGFDLNEIVTLTETEYSEKTVTSVRPHKGKGIHAMHTYANRENLTVIDALSYRLKWAKT